MPSDTSATSDMTDGCTWIGILIVLSNHNHNMEVDNMEEKEFPSDFAEHVMDMLDEFEGYNPDLD